MTIGIINTDIPNPFVASSGSTAKIRSDIQSVINRKRQIIGLVVNITSLSISIFTWQRGLWNIGNRQRHAVARTTNPCCINRQMRIETITQRNIQLMTVVKLIIEPAFYRVRENSDDSKITYKMRWQSNTEGGRLHRPPIPMNDLAPHMFLHPISLLTE